MRSFVNCQTAAIEAGMVTFTKLTITLASSIVFPSPAAAAILLVLKPDAVQAKRPRAVIVSGVVAFIGAHRNIGIFSCIPFGLDQRLRMFVFILKQLYLRFLDT